MHASILTYMYFRCREEPSEETDNEHVSKDIKELNSNSKETYTTWRQGSECKLLCMKNEVSKKDTEIYRSSLQTEKYSEFCHIKMDERVDDYLQDVASLVATSKAAYMAMHTLQMKKIIADTKRLAAIVRRV